MKYKVYLNYQYDNVSKNGKSYIAVLHPTHSGQGLASCTEQSAELMPVRYRSAPVSAHGNSLRAPCPPLYRKRNEHTSQHHRHRNEHPWRPYNVSEYMKDVGSENIRRTSTQGYQFQVFLHVHRHILLHHHRHVHHRQTTYKCEEIIPDCG